MNGSGPVDGSLAFVRMYNYAIPAADIPGEADVASGTAAWYRLSDTGSAVLGGSSSSSGGSVAAVVIIACSVAGAVVTAVILVALFLVLRRKRRVAAAAAADKGQCPSPTRSECSSEKCCDSLA